MKGGGGEGVITRGCFPRIRGDTIRGDRRDDQIRRLETAVPV